MAASDNPGWSCNCNVSWVYSTDYGGGDWIPDTVSSVIRNKFKSLRVDRVVNKTQEVPAGPFALTR